MRDLFSNFWMRLFSFAEYPVACCGDEGEENPPKPWRRRVVASENFAGYPAACCGELHFATPRTLMTKEVPCPL
jgi:hypothetical protein